MRWHISGASAAIGVMTLVISLASPATATVSENSVAPLATSSLRVVYHGRILSASDADQLMATRSKQGETFGIVYDSTSSVTGLAHAFDSQAAADEYGETLKSATPQNVERPLVRPALPTGCPDAKNISRMYDTADCGGTQFSFTLSESDNTLGTFNNKGNDIVAGWTTVSCIIKVRLFPSQNHSGTFADFYGDTTGGTTAQYYYFNSAQRNNFESDTATCS